MNFNIEQLLRENIRKLKPYSSARDEFSGEAEVFLDANENPYNSPWNRYPDPRQIKLKKIVGEIKKISSDHIFLGSGSDEPIDLLIRAFCEPHSDNIVSISPSYGMYKVAADVNAVKVIEVPLTEDFELDSDGLLKASNENTKVVFLCSPNNPSGNALDHESLIKIIDNFNGIVVIDEAYIDFCPEKSFLPLLNQYPNLVILQTFSKAWGMAGLRLGMAFASVPIIDILSRIKYPYNLSILTQQKAMELLSLNKKKAWVEIILKERTKLIKELSRFSFVKKIYPSDANFILVKTEDPKGIYQFLVKENIIVRDRSSVFLCEGCLRISVGSPEENSILLIALDKFSNKRIQ
jgi:histidinol-phosphate aminotransferase